MLYQAEITIEWAEGSHRTKLSVRAVSRKHALDKAVGQAVRIPCYKDRVDAGIDVRAEARLLEKACSICFEPSTDDICSICLEPNEANCPQ